MRDARRRSKNASIAYEIATFLGAARFAANDKVVFVRHFDFLTRGLFVERTSYKDTVRLSNYWEVFVLSQERPTLSFSRRLPNLTEVHGSTNFTGSKLEILEQIYPSINRSVYNLQEDEAAAVDSLLTSHSCLDLSLNRNLVLLASLATAALLTEKYKLAQDYYDACDRCLKFVELEKVLSPAYGEFISNLTNDISMFRKDVKIPTQHVRNRVRANAAKLGFLD